MDKPGSASVAILHETADFLIIGKPAGLRSVADRYQTNLPHVATELEAQFGPVFIVHRLDKEASGIMVVARNEASHRLLNQQFQTKLVRKLYHALVHGIPEWQQTQIDLPLLPDGDRQHRTIVHTQKGKPSLTLVRQKESFRRFSLLEVLPRTGRTHQIRAHLAALGLSIVADPLYGNPEPVRLSAIKPGYRGDPTNETPLLARLALHAYRISFQHPATGTAVTFVADHPADLQLTLRQLRRFDS